MSTWPCVTANLLLTLRQLNASDTLRNWHSASLIWATKRQTSNAAGAAVVAGFFDIRQSRLRTPACCSSPELLLLLLLLLHR
jgi:hypothetical protein